MPEILRIVLKGKQTDVCQQVVVCRKLCYNGVALYFCT